MSNLTNTFVGVDATYITSRSINFVLFFQVLLHWFRSHKKLEQNDVVAMLDNAEQLGYVQTKTAETAQNWDDSYLTKCKSAFLHSKLCKYNSYGGIYVVTIKA